MSAQNRAQKIRSVIGTYCKAVREMDVEAICALYTEDAILEDPAGSPQIRGKSNIRAFYTQYLTGRPGIRISADPIIIDGFSATPMHVDVEYNGKALMVELISVMAFDGDNRIRAMSAYFNQEALDD